jgi:uncharacterized membrane protein YoaK (UPF0700 family)
MTARGTRRIVLLFTFAAGSVDAVAYMAVHVFTANMTGNAVLMGIYVGQGHGTAVLHSLLALIVFIGGVVLGAILAGTGGDRAKTLAAVHREVLVETVILALFASSFLLPRPVESRVVSLLLIIFSALAMGLQSAAVRRLHLPGIATTYITGTLTNLVFGLTQHWGSRRLAGSSSPAEATATASASLKRYLVLQAQVFLCYALAALISGALYLRWPSAVAWLPVIAIGAVAMMMSSRPGQQLQAS